VAHLIQILWAILALTRRSVSTPTYQRACSLSDVCIHCRWPSRTTGWCLAVSPNVDGLDLTGRGRLGQVLDLPRVINNVCNQLTDGNAIDIFVLDPT
jgi:hypothetical protein